ncbi:MAG TPA: GntR family transcriptional regulator [Mycobacterium sp.]|jgi:DNA-binding GntR family transcriptional regulator|nr:GntR family transcriptional regulator [Mycobacterium sp.]
MALRVQALSIVDAIASDIRGNLFSGQLRSDTQLTEAEVAATYGVARPTAKAAIEKLVAEGLLLRGTHKTARVPAMGLDEVRDLYFSRLCIESEVVRRLAIAGTVPDIAAKANNEVVGLDSGSGMEVAEPVMRFHLGLVEALGSPRLSRLFGTLMGEMRLCMAQMSYRRLLHAPAIAEEHERILEEIASGNPEAAVAALADHLHRAENRLVPALEELTANSSEA